MVSAGGLNFGLGGLPLLSGAKTRSISAENPTGEVGGGARTEPEVMGPAGKLGPGWKARPSITLPAQSTVTLAEIAGPGVIQHIWITVDSKAFRDCILRFYWDGESSPSVEVPLGDFFVNGHGLRYNVVSLPVAVNPRGGLNCYWPMPFRTSCRITIENQHWDSFRGFFYQITYALGEVPPEAAYFHGQWRRAVTDRKHPDYVILDDVTGRGHYVGTFLAWTALSNGWWGEGEIKFYLDDDREYPTICGTGTEDYFGGAWGFYGETNREEVFCAPFSGLPLARNVDNEVRRFGLYRWHVMDPIRFDRELRVTIQALAYGANDKFLPLADDIASTAYWYQSEPHGRFPALPGVEERWSQ